MKDSGVEWIGEIPESWKTKKVKSILRETSEKNHAAAEVLSLYRDLGVVIKSTRNDNHNVTSQDTGGYKFVRKNDVVINKMKAWQGSLAVSNYEGIVSPAYYTFSITDNDIIPEFLNYALRNPAYTQEYARLSAGLRVGQWDLSKDAFKKLLYVFPSKEQQKKIVSVLSQKISQIDSIISETQQSIDELKKYKQALITETVTKGLDKNAEMKDSGIDILPLINDGWKVERVKNLFSMTKGLSITKENLEDEGIPVISYGEIHSKYGFNFNPEIDYVKNVNTSYLENSKSALLEKGDFIFADTSEDINGSGNFTCFTGSIKTFAGYHTIILKAKVKFNYQYLAYLFDSSIFRSQIQKSVQGIKVFSITQRILKNQWVWLPPIEIQDEIVKYLDGKRIVIDKLISEKLTELNELDTYKKSLIFEYVTGKKEA